MTQLFIHSVRSFIFLSFIFLSNFPLFICHFKTNEPSFPQYHHEPQARFSHPNSNGEVELASFEVNIFIPIFSLVAMLTLGHYKKKKWNKMLEQGQKQSFLFNILFSLHLSTLPFTPTIPKSMH